MGNEYFEENQLSARYWRDYLVVAIKKIKGNKCEECGSTKRLCVHHEDYAKQNIDTLKLLCFNCHMNLHKEGNA